MSSEVTEPLAQLFENGLPRHRSSLDEEWRAATSACAAFPAVHRAMTRITGEDRVSFLHGMLTNDVRRLAPPAGLPAAFLNDSAHVVADMRLYCGIDAFEIDCLSWRRDALHAGLDRYLIADDVEIEVDEKRVPLVCLEGPESSVVAERCVAAPGEIEPFATAPGRFAGEDLAVHAVSDSGGSGRLISGPPALRDALLDACSAAGATPAGLATLDVLRVEAGIAWAGVDMDESTLLMEIGLPEVISRTKGCYLGQETVERVSARGQVNRSLTALAIDADLARMPVGSLAVYAEGAAVVGSVTSRVYSPALGVVLGMGLLHRKAREASLQVALGDDRVPCRVVEFPRPRS